MKAFRSVGRDHDCCLALYALKLRCSQHNVGVSDEKAIQIVEERKSRDGDKAVEGKKVGQSKEGTQKEGRRRSSIGGRCIGLLHAYRKRARYADRRYYEDRVRKASCSCRQKSYLVTGKMCTADG
jgi:hypothetical protein